MASLEILNQMDEESNENHRKRKYLTYSKRKKAPKTSPSHPNPPKKSPLPLDANTTQPTFPKNDSTYLNIDMASILAKINVPVRLTEIMNIPSLRDKVKRFPSIQDEYEDPFVVLQAMHYDRKNEEHAPFFISLIVE